MLTEPTGRSVENFHDTMLNQLLVASACYHAEQVIDTPEEYHEVAIMERVMDAHPDMYEEYEATIRSILSVMLNSPC
jgi:hypothetical protein